MNQMSVLEWFLLVVGPNLIAGIAMFVQRRRHLRYREAVHAFLGDQGYVEGEAEMIVDEMLRASISLKLPEPTAQQFAYSLLKQKSFRRAVVHAELHNIYIETNGRAA